MPLFSRWNRRRIDIEYPRYPMMDEYTTTPSVEHFPATWRLAEAEIAEKMSDTLGLGVLERARDVLFDKIVLVNATRAYLHEKGAKPREMADFVHAQLPLICRFDKTDVWGWQPDTSHSTCAWMKLCVEIVTHKDFRPEPCDEMVTILANYTYHRRRDSPDQRVIQGIHDILRGLPKDTFVTEICDSGQFNADELGKC